MTIATCEIFMSETLIITGVVLLTTAVVIYFVTRKADIIIIKLNEMFKDSAYFQKNVASHLKTTDKEILALRKDKEKIEAENKVLKKELEKTAEIHGK